MYESARLCVEGRLELIIRPPALKARSTTADVTGTEKKLECEFRDLRYFGSVFTKSAEGKL